MQTTTIARKEEQILNKDFELIKSIDFNNDKKLSFASQLLFLLIVALGVAVLYLLNLPQGNKMRIGYIILSCVAYILAHELTHIVFMRLCSKEKILFHFKLPYLAVGSKFYFNKKQFFIIALAPFVLFSVVLLALFFICPKGVDFLLSVLIIVNIAGSSGDFIQVYEISKLDKDIYIQDDSKSTKVYIQKANNG